MGRDDAKPIPGYRTTRLPPTFGDKAIVRPESFPPGGGEIVVRGPGWKANFSLVAVVTLISTVLSYAVHRTTPSADSGALEQEMRTYRMQRERDIEDRRQEIESLRDEMRDLKTKLSLIEERTRTK